VTLDTVKKRMMQRKEPMQAHKERLKKSLHTEHLNKQEKKY